MPPPADASTSNRHADANVHSGHPDAVNPNCEPSAVWFRDPADGQPISALLDRIAQRRGEAAVRAAVARWLREGR